MAENHLSVNIDVIIENIKKEVLSAKTGTSQLEVKAITPHETHFWVFFRKINMRLKKYPFHSAVAPLIGLSNKILSPFKYERSLNVADLLCMGHEDLLRACYIKILGREPDREGMEYNLLMLRTGRVDDLSVISNFVNSDEAKNNRFRVSVKGLRFLRFKRAVKKIPLLGYLLTVAVSLFLLPKRLEEINHSVSRFARNLEGLNRWRAEATALSDSLRSEISVASSDIYGLKRSVRTPMIKTSQFEKFYFDFEDSFRGPETEITKRLGRYVGYLKRFSKGSGVLDLGCGRGEWLELLRKNGYKGVGVDENSLMVEKTRSKGLEAFKQNFLDYLHSQPNRSFSCITGFHIAEHLQFNELIELVKVAHRVLKDDGIFILELPYTGGERTVLDRFYLDPTHIKPVPPELLKFLFEHENKFRCEMLMLHPEDPTKPETSLDYSIIGYKSE